MRSTEMHLFLATKSDKAGNNGAIFLKCGEFTPLWGEILLPFDGRRRFRRDVIDYSVHSAHLIYNII